jgi:hypothetical protein
VVPQLEALEMRRAPCQAAAEERQVEASSQAALAMLQARVAAAEVRKASRRKAE